MDATDGVEQLPVHECWALMRTTTVGRLAVWVDDHPDIFPLNFVVDHGTVVFRTAAGAKLRGALSGTAVALEADGYDPATSRAWSVVVKGKAQAIAELDDVVGTVDLPLFPWQGGDKGHFIRIAPSLVTGRRFVVEDPSAWRTPSSDTRRASME